MEAYTISNREAVTVTKRLVDQMFSRFSPPDQLHSDQGKQFKSVVVQEICKFQGMLKSRTSPHHPQCDGVLKGLTWCCSRFLLPLPATSLWLGLRHKFLNTNTSVHDSTGYTPFFLMFGRKARMPNDSMYLTDTARPPVVQTAQYAATTLKSWQETYHQVRRTLAISHARCKDNCDKKTYGQPFKTGDHVWLHYPAVQCEKLRKPHHPWSEP